ncbi:sulfotransferase 2B1-like isoform X11 [Pelodiscus sinensis]
MPWFTTRLGLEAALNYPPPRLLTCHLPIQLFPTSFFGSRAKVIYTLRNPKDVLVSYFYFSKMCSSYEDPESFEQFLGDFLSGDVPHGSWFDHVRGWMEMKGKDNFFFTTYEELQQDLRGSVQRLCQFLGQALDEGALTAVVENASFRAMQENQMCNSTLLPADIMDQEKGTFLRKGSTSRVSLQPLQLAPSACDTSLNLTGTALQTEVHVLGVRCCVIACPGTLGALNALLLGSQPDTHSLRQAHGALCAPACGFLLPSRAEFPPARPFAGVRGAGFLSPPCWQGPSHLALTPALPTPPAPCPEGPEQGQVSLLVKYYSLKREAMFW